MTHGRRIAVIVSVLAIAALGLGGLASAHSHDGEDRHGHHHQDRQHDPQSDSWVGSDYGFNGFGDMFKHMDMKHMH
jgi:hypothetical protein